MIFEVRERGDGEVEIIADAEGFEAMASLMQTKAKMGNKMVARFTGGFNTVTLLTAEQDRAYADLTHWEQKDLENKGLL